MMHRHITIPRSVYPHHFLKAERLSKTKKLSETKMADFQLRASLKK
jgi:hypothetical protein